MSVRQAFYPYLEMKMCQEPQDVVWIMSMFKEIKERLLSIMPEETEFHGNVEQSIDLELFEQMLEHNALDKNDLLKLSNYTFTKLLEICRPDKDPIVEMRRRHFNDVMEETSLKACMALYVHYVNETLDEIADDIESAFDVVQTNYIQ